jgi:hypothetical protein
MIPVICDNPDRRGTYTSATSFACIKLFSGFGEYPIRYLHRLYDPDSVNLLCVASDDCFGQRAEDEVDPGIICIPFLF